MPQCQRCKRYFHDQQNLKILFSSWLIFGHLLYHSWQSNTHYIWMFAHFRLTTETQKYCEKINSWKSIFEWRSCRDRNCFDVWWFNCKCLSWKFLGPLWWKYWYFVPKSNCKVHFFQNFNPSPILSESWTSPIWSIEVAPKPIVPSIIIFYLFLLTLSKLLELNF